MIEIKRATGSLTKRFAQPINKVIVPTQMKLSSLLNIDMISESSKFDERSSAETEPNAKIQAHINSEVRQYTKPVNTNNFYEIDCIIYANIVGGRRSFSTAINRRMVPKEDEDLQEQNNSVHDFETVDPTIPRKWVLYENETYKEISETFALKKAERQAYIVIYTAIKS